MDLDDGRICRFLKSREIGATVSYNIQTVTSDIQGAGTDAIIFISLHGLCSDSKRFPLDSGPWDFERCQSVWISSIFEQNHWVL